MHQQQRTPRSTFYFHFLLQVDDLLDKQQDNEAIDVASEDDCEPAAIRSPSCSNRPPQLSLPLPSVAEASQPLPEKAKQAGHASIGKRGRRGANKAPESVKEAKLRLLAEQEAASAALEGNPRPLKQLKISNKGQQDTNTSTKVLRSAGTPGARVLTVPGGPLRMQE